MYARCDTIDLLVHLMDECALIEHCNECYQYRNCTLISLLYKYKHIYTLKEIKYVSPIIENYMIYTDGETP